MDAPRQKCASSHRRTFLDIRAGMQGPGIQEVTARRYVVTDVSVNNLDRLRPFKIGTA
jgi:hypothetical protein